MDEMLQQSPLEILMVGVLLLLLSATVAEMPPLKPLNSIMMWKTSHEVVDGKALQVEVDSKVLEEEAVELVTREEGHMSRECPNPNSGGGGGDRTCHKCQQPGHTQGIAQREVEVEIVHCQETGHMARDCQREVAVGLVRVTSVEILEIWQGNVHKMVVEIPNASSVKRKDTCQRIAQWKASATMYNSTTN
ncbi:hypothetical protein DAPPUDRAFT_267907 [Daphnia pulex]|uniref:CCHC-type domain-containing protein n=1 Tax=Daphnia pulex TaxID=6669 RepID=E9HX36_DAPPU|nr:hypothetical protein DAPPUDRAFT_267907 [Daphnia pulex]|eukprot:EFX63689.1 hypothetical protein DAPPUDRAFT_267907 [Daphnia pulex]